MSTRTRHVSGTKDFAPCPEYDGPAVCVDVTEPRLYQSEHKDEMKFKFVFEVDLLNEGKGQPFCVWSRPMTETVHKKSTLRAFLKSWYGRDLTPEEIEDTDLESLVGRPAHLIVINETRDNTIYANIQLIRPAKPGEILKPSGKFVREFEREKKDDGGPSAGSGKPGGATYARTSSSGAPQKPPSKTAPGAAAKDPKGVVVHISKEKGHELKDLPPEKVKGLIENWLERDFLYIRKPSADDKRLAIALKLVKDEIEAAESGGGGEGEGEPKTDY